MDKRDILNKLIKSEGLGEKKTYKDFCTFWKYWRKRNYARNIFI